MLKSIKMACASALLLFAHAGDAQSGEFDAERYVFERDTEATQEEALSVYADGMQFGAWHVEKENDEMSPTAIVAMVTPAEKLRNGEPSGRFGYFGLQFVGPSDPSIHTSADGRDYWPYCDFDIASISVDGAKVRYIAEIEDPGFCDKFALNGITARHMKAGAKAKIRLNGRDYLISLEGFSAALSHARALAR